MKLAVRSSNPFPRVGYEPKGDPNWENLKMVTSRATTPNVPLVTQWSVDTFSPFSPLDSQTMASAGVGEGIRISGGSCSGLDVV